MAKRNFSANVKEKTLIISDFTELNGEGVNLKVKKDGLFPAFKRGTKIADNTTENLPLLYFEFDEGKYMYNSDKYVRRVVSGAYLYVSKFNSRPELITVSDGEDNYTFLVASNQSYSFSANAIVSFKGTSVTLFNNSLFVIDGGVLKFSAPFDYLDSSHYLKANGSFKPEDDIGNALKIAHGFDKLYVLCEKGLVIGELKGKDIDYSFKGISRAEQSVDANSTLSFGDKLCFTERGKFCVFDGGKLNRYDTPLGEHKYEVLAEPFNFNGYYLAEVMLDGDNTNKKTLAVNIFTGEAFFVKFNNAVVCADEVICDTVANAYYPITEDTSSSVGDSIFSFSLDFGVSGRKKIIGVSAYAEGSPEVTVSGLFGAYAFTLENGRTEVKIGAPSEKFDFSVQGSGCFTLKDLKIKYLTGE